MTSQDVTALIEWASAILPVNGLVLVKAIWSGRTSLDFSDNRILLPGTKMAMKTQPFTLAVVLNPGYGYRDLRDGQHKGSDLSPGDIVIAEQYVAYEFELLGNKINYIPENMILSIVKGVEVERFQAGVLH